MSTTTSSRLVFTPGNVTGNSSGSSGHDRYSESTRDGTKGSPRGMEGCTVSYFGLPSPVASRTSWSRLTFPQRWRNRTVFAPFDGDVRASKVIAVPTWMPSLLNSVEKILGSGFPSGVVFPVLYLSPFRQSIQMWSNVSKYRSRIPVNDKP